MALKEENKYFVIGPDLFLKKYITTMVNTNPHVYVYQCFTHMQFTNNNVLRYNSCTSILGQLFFYLCQRMPPFAIN